MRDAYRDSDGWRAHDGPPAVPKRPEPGNKVSIFRPIVYDGSALVLYALRQEIGADAFQRVERSWVRAYRYRSVTSADFSALASRIAGRDLSGFFHLAPWRKNAADARSPGLAQCPPESQVTWRPLHVTIDGSPPLRVPGFLPGIIGGRHAL